MQDNKVKWWGMRADQKDRKKISNLAKRLGVKQSAAVRLAVVYMLANMPKTAKVR